MAHFGRIVHRGGGTAIYVREEFIIKNKNKIYITVQKSILNIVFLNFILVIVCILLFVFTGLRLTVWMSL